MSPGVASGCGGLSSARRPRRPVVGSSPDLKAIDVELQGDIQPCQCNHPIPEGSPDAMYGGLKTCMLRKENPACKLRSKLFLSGEEGAVGETSGLDPAESYDQPQSAEHAAPDSGGERGRILHEERQLLRQPLFGIAPYRSAYRSSRGLPRANLKTAV